MGEGFGLPLVEAARRGVPIVARDLGVFREVAGPHAFYFSGSTADELATALRKWLQLHAAGRHPRSEGMPLVTWSDSTNGLLDVAAGRTLARDVDAKGSRWAKHAARRCRRAFAGESNALPCDSTSNACSSATHPETAMNSHERSKPDTAIPPVARVTRLHGTVRMRFPRPGPRPVA